MIRRPPRSTLSSSSAASDVYKRQRQARATEAPLCLPCDAPPAGEELRSPGERGREKEPHRGCAQTSASRSQSCDQPFEARIILRCLLRRKAENYDSCHSRNLGAQQTRAVTTFHNPCPLSQEKNAHATHC